MRAIDRAGLVFEALGCAERRAMHEAEARGNIMNVPLRILLTYWWLYAAVTRIPELRDEVPFHRDRLRWAVTVYRATREMQREAA